MLIKLFSNKSVTKVASVLQMAVETNHFGVMQIHNLKETVATRSTD